MIEMISELTPFIVSCRRMWNLHYAISQLPWYLKYASFSAWFLVFFKWSSGPKSGFYCLFLELEHHFSCCGDSWSDWGSSDVEKNFSCLVSWKANHGQGQRGNQKRHIPWIHKDLARWILPPSQVPWQTQTWLHHKPWNTGELVTWSVSVVDSMKGMVSFSMLGARNLLHVSVAFPILTCGFLQKGFFPIGSSQEKS